MLHEALRLVRQFHTLNQTEMADRLGISKSYLSQIEHGHKKPTLDLLEKYAEVFGIPLSNLLLFSESVGDPRPAKRVRRAVARKAVKMLQWLEAITQDAEEDEEEHV